MNKILVVAPHPDDDVLGCGGVMARFASAGCEVYVAIMTNGNVGAPELFPVEGTERGRAEALEAHKLLKVRETFFFDFPCPRLDTQPAYKISIELNKLIQCYKIDTLFVPHRGDIHKDHRIIYEASLVAARPIGPHKVSRILAYETLSETEWAPPFPDDAFIPTVFMAIDDYIDIKGNAFACFTPPRKKEYPHSRSIDGVKTLARYRGATIETLYAEAFMLIREIL